MKALRILLVDDEPAALAALAATLGESHQVQECESGESALARLRDNAYDLLMTDLSMAPPDGFDLLRCAPGLAPGMPIVVVTAHDTARAAVRALRLGARDFLVKPASREEIMALIDRVAFEHEGREPAAQQYGLIGRGAAIRSVRQLVPLLARCRETALIRGESGTGRERLARAIHAAGPRAGGPFVSHAVAATAPERAERAWFGEARPARSAAKRRGAGLFERADGGTLYVDGVEAFPLPLQARLLRVMEGGPIRGEGGEGERTPDVRVIASTSADLAELSRQRRFRADLCFHLRQLEIELPPLRDRLEDLPALVEQALAELDPHPAAEPLVTRAAMAILRAHDWPGNLRELRGALRSARLLAGAQPIQPSHLPTALAGAARRGAGADWTLAEAEREHIRKVLEEACGNRSRAAKALGIDRGTLSRKIRTMGLESLAR